MKLKDLQTGMVVALKSRAGLEPRMAVIVDPHWHRLKVVVAVKDVFGDWRPVFVRPQQIVGLYDEARAAHEAEEEARRARNEARNSIDDQWHKRKIAVLDRLQKILPLRDQDRRRRISFGRFTDETPAHRVDMAIEDMEQIAAMLEAKQSRDSAAETSQ